MSLKSVNRRRVLQSWGKTSPPSKEGNIRPKLVTIEIVVVWGKQKKGKARKGISAAASLQGQQSRRRGRGDSIEWFSDAVGVRRGSRNIPKRRPLRQKTKRQNICFPSKRWALGNTSRMPNYSEGKKRDADIMGRTHKFKNSYPLLAQFLLYYKKYDCVGAIGTSIKTLFGYHWGFEGREGGKMNLREGVG